MKFLLKRRKTRRKNIYEGHLHVVTHNNRKNNNNKRGKKMQLNKVNKIGNKRNSKNDNKNSSNNIGYESTIRFGGV